MRVGLCPIFLFIYFFPESEKFTTFIFFPVPKRDAPESGSCKYNCSESFRDLFHAFSWANALVQCSKFWFCKAICYQAPGLDPQQNLELVEVHQHQRPAVFLDPICSPLTFNIMLWESAAIVSQLHTCSQPPLDSCVLCMHRDRERCGRELDKHWLKSININKTGWQQRARRLRVKEQSCYGWDNRTGKRRIETKGRQHLHFNKGSVCIWSKRPLPFSGRGRCTNIY